MRVRDPRAPGGWRDEGPQAQYGSMLSRMPRPEALTDLVSSELERQVSGDEPGAVRGWHRVFDAVAVSRGLSKRRRCAHCQKVIPERRSKQARYCSLECRARRYKHRPPIAAVRRCLRCGTALGSYRPQGTLYCKRLCAKAAWREAHLDQVRAADRDYARRRVAKSSASAG